MSRFLDAARRQAVDVTPVWLMRQAGRSLPEYRKLRERWTLADIVAQPELCAEVTLASYLIEGRPSRTFAKVKAFMYTQPQAFDLLMDKLAGTMSRYLQAQVAVGAQAVQLFDSWVGALTRDDYDTRVARHTRAIFDALAPSGVPRIHFGTDTAHLLESIVQTGPDIVSLDWRVPLDEGWD